MSGISKANECRDCDDLGEKLGIKIAENSVNKGGTYGKYVLTGCGIITGTIIGLTFPFISPGFRKVCLPYVPATDTQVENVFKILRQFRRNGSLVDLGSGDGRIVIEASRRNFHAVGIELNYPLVLFSRLRNIQLKSSAKFFRRDLWKVDLCSYDNIVIFGVESMMARVEKKIMDEADPNCKIVACRFPLPTMKPLAEVGEGIDTISLNNGAKDRILGPTRDEGFGTEDWLKEKFNLGLEFPNLPYYIDGDVKLTQSAAILRYIGEKHGLNGSSAEERAVIDMLVGEAYDIRKAFANVCYSKTFEEEKPGYIESAKGKMESISNFLGNKDFFAKNLSTADFVLYESLYCVRKLEASLIENHKNLADFMARIEALPNIKKYIESNRYVSSPINGPIALFGGKKEE